MVGRALSNSPADGQEGPVREMIEAGFPSASTSIMEQVKAEPAAEMKQPKKK